MIVEWTSNLAQIDIGDVIAAKPEILDSIPALHWYHEGAVRRFQPGHVMNAIAHWQNQQRAHSEGRLAEIAPVLLHWHDGRPLEPHAEVTFNNLPTSRDC